MIRSRVLVLGFCGVLATFPPAMAQSIGGSASLTATTASSNVALPAAKSQYPSLLIFPAAGSSGEAFFALGSSSVAATVSSTPLPSGGVCVDSFGPATTIAAITATGTVTVRVVQQTNCTTFAGAGSGGTGGGASGPSASATQLKTSVTGTTTATTATLAATAGKTNYLCGYTIDSDATAATVGNATVTGLIGGTLSRRQGTGPVASGTVSTYQNFAPCLPASAANTAISVVSAAPGTGGNVAVTAWGYQQ